VYVVMNRERVGELREEKGCNSSIAEGHMLHTAGLFRVLARFWQGHTTSLLQAKRRPAGVSDRIVLEKSAATTDGTQY
jgi:hypothetical protein